MLFPLGVVPCVQLESSGLGWSREATWEPRNGSFALPGNGLIHKVSETLVIYRSWYRLRDRMR